MLRTHTDVKDAYKHFSPPLQHDKDWDKAPKPKKMVI